MPWLKFNVFKFKLTILEDTNWKFLCFWSIKLLLLLLQYLHKLSHPELAPTILTGRKKRKYHVLQYLLINETKKHKCSIQTSETSERNEWYGFLKFPTQVSVLQMYYNLFTATKCKHFGLECIFSTQILAVLSAATKATLRCSQCCTFYVDALTDWPAARSWLTVHCILEERILLLRR